MTENQEEWLRKKMKKKKKSWENAGDSEKGSSLENFIGLYIQNSLQTLTYFCVRLLATVRPEPNPAANCENDGCLTTKTRTMKSVAPMAQLVFTTSFS